MEKLTPQKQRTKVELDSGLRMLVSHYIEIRAASPRVAPHVLGGVKMEIDRIIKDKKLNRKMVYFCYGDPDDPQDNKDVHRRAKLGRLKMYEEMGEPHIVSEPNCTVDKCESCHMTRRGCKGIEGEGGLT